ncbi:MAG: hypothetical protein Q7J68_01060 [Thermoplasmata archaeon]|nr:hypothetical protein [Thermoplasmata archaeon]
MGDMLSFASYTIVKKFGNGDGEVDGLWFNKVISLLNKELKDEYGKDMKLPHYWYFWGDMVSIRDMPTDLQLLTDEADGMKSKFKWVSGRPTGASGDDEKKIKSLVDSIYSRYPQTREGKQTILTDVYAYAPYEFQRLYKEFRTDTFEIVDQPFQPLKRHFIKSDFAKAMKEFPYVDFPDMAVPATTVRILGEALMSVDSEGCSHEAQTLMKEFWEALCKRLRIAENGHENISPIIYEKLLEESISELKKYEGNLQKKTISILEKCDLPNIRDDPALYSFISPSDWGEGTEDTSERIDEILYS